MRKIKKKGTENDKTASNFISRNELMSQKNVIEGEIRANYFISEADIQDCVQTFVRKLPMYDSIEHRKEIMKTIKELAYRCEAISQIEKNKLPSTSQPIKKNITPQRDFTRKRKRNGSKK